MIKITFSTLQIVIENHFREELLGREDEVPTALEKVIIIACYNNIACSQIG